MKTSLSLLLVLLLASLSLTAKPKDLLDLGRYSDVKVSPNGNYIAAKFQTDDGRIRLWVRDFQKEKNKIVTPRNVTQGQWGEKNVTDFAWVNNEYIVIVADWGDEIKSLHMAKVKSLDPDAVLPVISDKGVNVIVDPIPGSSRYLVSNNESEKEFSPCTVSLMDAEDRKNTQIVYQTKSKTFEAIADRQHNLRLVKKEPAAGEEFAWFSKAVESDTWNRMTLNPWINIHGFDQNSDRILVAGSFWEQPQGLYYYSVSKDKVLQKLLSDPTYPLDKIATPVFHGQSKQLVGAHVAGIQHKSQWINPRIATIQKNVNAASPDSTNKIVAWDDQLTRIVVERIYPSQPHAFCAFDFKKGVMDYLFDNGGNLKKGEASKTTRIEFENRDGNELTGFLTRAPKAKSKAPLLVIIRNNPFTTFDRIGWKADDQYFASLGYTVLRLNFSGSGDIKGPLALDWKKPESALKPIHDLEDAIKWIKENGFADTSRAAIVGSGAGGWIATHSLIASPGTFKCAISNDAVYDLVGYQTKGLSSGAGHPFAEKGNALTGEQLAALSPMKNLSKIKGALFLAYGQWNNEAYKQHVKDFARDAKAAGIEVDKVLEGGWWGGNVTSNGQFYDFNQKITAFLKKNL